jgi:hypothetical protein
MPYWRGVWGYSIAAFQLRCVELYLKCLAGSTHYLRYINHLDNRELRLKVRDAA